MMTSNGERGNGLTPIESIDISVENAHSSTGNGDDEVPRSSGRLLTLAIDTERERYPFCIVWTPIPCLTMFFPFVGHMGIADSKGIIFDFAGPYTISVDDLSFGHTTRYIQVFSSVDEIAPETAEAWDQAIRIASDEYVTRMHNLFCDNCHSHVAYALNHLGFRGFRNWNMVVLATWMFFCGTFVSFGRFLQSVLPTLFVVLLFVFISHI